MANGTLGKKHCGPQHMVESGPSREWSLKELGEYCRDQHNEIVYGEKKLAPYYWQLGMALKLAKRKCMHGQWRDYLASLDIDPTRASRARAIYRTFKTIDALADRSVEEAYAKRKRVKTTVRQEVKGDALEPPHCFAWIGQIRRESQILSNEPISVSPDEARQLREMLNEAIECLQKFSDRLVASDAD